MMDYSHQRMRLTTKELLLGLGDAAKLTDKIQQLFNGHHINATEDRAVLHPALRAPACVPVPAWVLRQHKPTSEQQKSNAERCAFLRGAWTVGVRAKVRPWTVGVS